MPLREIKLEQKDITQLFVKQTPFTRAFSLLKKLLTATFTLAAVFLVLFVTINYSAYIERFNYESGNIETVSIPEPPAPIAATPEPLPDYSPEIIIPKLGVQAPINMFVESADMLVSLKTGVAHFNLTATPNERGNTVIIGHSSDYAWSDGRFKNIFATLDKLVIGDEIIVPYKIDKYIYRVTETKIVSPKDLSVLLATRNPTLTLISCYPVGSTRSRIIIRAELISGTVNSEQSSEPNIGTLPQSR